MHILALLLLTGLLTACSITDSIGDFGSSVVDYISGADNAEPPAELTEYKPEIEAEEIWKETVGEGSGKRHLKLVPAVSARSVVVADHEGVVQAFNPENGDEQWETETEMHLSAGPGIGEKVIVFASSQADVIALNPSSGQVQWKTKVTSEVLAAPLIAEGLVIIRTTDGRIVALDETDGRRRWSYERSVPVLSLRGTSAPVVTGDTLISGFDNGKLLALRLQDGKQVWEASIAMPKGRSEVERLVDLDADPVLGDGVLYVASYQGGVSAVSVQNGEVTWRNPDVSVYSSLHKDRRYLYVSDASSDVWQLDQGNGASLWKQKDLHQRKLTAAVPYGNYVVVGDYEGYVHWLSVSDGRQLGRVKVSSEPIVVPPVVKDDKVYVYSKDGKLVALKVKPV